jgi:hypothetical protein
MGMIADSQNFPSICGIGKLARKQMQQLHRERGEGGAGVGWQNSFPGFLWSP